MKPADKAMIASYCRSAIAAALTLFMTGNTNPADLAKGALAAVLPPLLRWLNASDPAFGRGLNK